MGKFKTYSRYFIEYLKHGDFLSILASLNYLINGTSHKKDRIIRTLSGSFFCRKNTNDFQFANHAYEWGVKKFFLDNCKEFTVFIDGGACVGSYSILLAKQGLSVVAFEPISVNGRILMKNRELNQLTDKIKIYPVGLGDSNRMADFVFDPVNTGASHLSRMPDEGNCSVEIRTLDSFIPEFTFTEDDRILIKLDIEGMEKEAIMGATIFIKKYPYITFVLEDKHTGMETIQDALSGITSFEFGIVDKFNIYAKKMALLKN